MQNFLIGAAVGIGGFMVLSSLSTHLGNQNPGGPWDAACKSIGGVPQSTTTPYSCNKNGVETFPTVVYPIYQSGYFQMGVPLIAAGLMTQSIAGAIGAAIGIAGIGLIGLQGIS